MKPALPPGLADPAEWRRVPGGDICESWQAEWPDGRRAFVKRTPYAARIEADGLAALDAAGAPVPEVLGVDAHTLVLEWLEGSPDWEGLGRALAQVHRTTADAFGWDSDNRLGSLIQRNGWWGDWGTFYAERRVRPFLSAGGLTDALRARLHAALDGPLRELLTGHAPAPSLVHGDLWSGNVVDGRWLVDPAVCFADRELDLAFAAVFGGFPDAFSGAYLEAWPLPDGWERRRPALQLYHLLAHVKLFGGGYADSVAARLDQLGW
jgi:fructosamine-3-kinase